MSFVDLNRTGVALMEIVSRPDIRSADEAKAYVNKLRTIVRYLGTCDGNMDKGSMRADVNVSVRRPGEPFGTRCEIKNVNSIRFVGQAIEAEARRQIAILEAGGTIDQETRLYDPAKGETRSMRSKEDAHDYRYFPDPDLLPLEFSQAYVDSLKSDLPELPDAKKERFVSQMGLSAYDAAVLVADKPIADYFEQVAEGRDGKTAANWVINNLQARLIETGTTVDELKFEPAAIRELVAIIDAGTISSKGGQEVFAELFENGGSPAAIVEARGLAQVSDSGELDKWCQDAIDSNPGPADDYRNGKENAINFLKGQVMKASRGKANPEVVGETLAKLLKG